MAAQARPLLPATPRHRRRTDQSRGLDVVPSGDRQGALPDRRHVVADRDGGNHDRTDPRRGADEAGIRHASAAGHRSRDPQPGRQGAAGEPGRLPRGDPPLAGDAAHRVRRPRALHAAVLEPDARHLLHGRRRAAGSRRLLLGDGPHRRRGERRGPPARHHGGGERAGEPPVGGRGRGRGPPRRPEGPGDCRVRQPRVGAPRVRGPQEGAQGARREGDRRLRAPRRHPLHGRAAEDPERQDHAPAAARHRRREGYGRRYDDARGLLGAREAAGGRGIARVGLVLTNTLSGRKEALVARAGETVGVYWCGVTAYSRSHVGHARAFITVDVLCRYLRARGHAVTLVRNFTDVDDKIIRRAAEEGITAAALAERAIAAFAGDVAWLQCLRPTHEPRATDHIDDMIALIERLVTAEYAYPVCNGSVYYRVRRFADYGNLSHQRLEDMSPGEGIDPDKEDVHDFALWKGAKPGEPTWPSPWGPGS